MNEKLIPEWIKTEAGEQEQENLRNEAEDNQNEAAELTIKAETPEYWRWLVKELTLGVESLSEFQMGGNVLQRPSGLENHCRVMVQALGAIPRQTYIDLYHTVNTRVVRCSTLGGKAFQLHFAVRPDGRGIGLVAGDDFTVMTPEQAAEYIMRPTVKWVRSGSASVY
jgi:hypothetical protein